MKILITGGTGFIGRSLSLALLADDHAITILSRYPNVEISHLDQDIYKMVKLRIHEYLVQNGYLNEKANINETV